MKKILVVMLLFVTLTGCSILAELTAITAITKCEFSFHSAQDPVVAGGQPTRLSLKIKPSVYVGSTMLTYPDYFTITKDFT